MKLAVTWPPTGRYILAVSGGADSMVLLDLMANTAKEHSYELVVAHFDHGLRPDSASDRAFVETVAEKYGLSFISHAAGLAPGSSEATARTARHRWLEQTRISHAATAVITAHHRDDLLETSLLNLARGSGRRGLAPMPKARRGGQVSTIIRPLLTLTRTDLRQYAAAHDLTWREDPTNADISNPRNLLRHGILPKAKPGWAKYYLELVDRLSLMNKKIDRHLERLLADSATAENNYSFPRALIRDLSLPELEELIAAIARRLEPGIELDRRLVQELALFAKTARPHRHRPIRAGLQVVVEPDRVSVYYMGTSVSEETII